MQNSLDFKKIISFPKKWWLVGASIIAVCIVVNPVLTIIAVAAVVTFFGFFIFPQIIIPFLLIIRSSLDIFTDVGFYIGPMLINIPSITSLFLIFGGGFYLLFNAAVRKEVVLDKVGKAFLLWLASLLFWVFLAYINFGVDGLIALREWVRLASLFVIYLLVYHLTKLIGYKKIIFYLFWALPIPLITGIYQIITSTGINALGVNRVSGTLAHPNYFSLFLVVFIGLTLWKIRFAKGRLAWVILLATELFVLINTFSISGMIMFLIMSTLLIVKILKIRHRLIISILVIVTLISFVLSPSGQKRLGEISQTGDVIEIIETGRASGGGSLAWRVLNWSFLIKEWRKKTVFGYGLHTTSEMINPFRNEAHNDYLRFLVETGLIGLLLFLFFIGILGREIWKLYSASLEQDIEFSYLVLVSFSVYAAWIIGSFADNFITATAFQYYFWTLTGILMARTSLLCKSFR